MNGEDDQQRAVDRDSLHILPLGDLPMETPGLASARLIKNSHLQGVIEVFSDTYAGSGQLNVESLPAEFGWNPDNPPKEYAMLRRLCRLPSYDVYSLRVSLREQGVEVNTVDALKLSENKNAELTEYMKSFTRPLISQIYGSDQVEIQDFGDVVKLFRDPDISKALEKLRIMADKLEIKPEEIPKFMEDYGDIFLSLSYYRQCLDSLVPIIAGFLFAVDDIKGNFQMKSDIRLMETCEMLESIISERLSGITGRVENFARSTAHMWDEISAARFRQIERVISSYHTNIGGVLCALSVKLDAWHKMFPDPTLGGPARKAEFIMTEMRQGITSIEQVDHEGSLLSFDS